MSSEYVFQTRAARQGSLPGVRLGLALALVMASLVSCSSGRGASNAQSGVPAAGSEAQSGDPGREGSARSRLLPPVPGPDEAVDPRDHGITLTDATVVIRGGQGVVRSVSADGRTFTLESSADGVEQLKEGSVLLVTGMLAGRVETVRSTDDGVAVTLGPVGLTDLIEDGRLEFSATELRPSAAIVHTWEEPIDADSYSAASSDATPQVTGAVARGPVQAQLASMTGGGPPVQSSGSTQVTYGDYQIKISSSGKDNGDVTREIAVTGTRGGIDFTMSAKASMSRFRADGVLDVVGGVVGDGRFEVSGLSGSVELKATAHFTSGDKSFDDLIKVPWEESYPIILSGIPFYVSLKASLSATPSFTTSPAELGASVKVSFDGKGGWTLQDRLLSPIEELVFQEVESPTSTAMSSFGAAGLVVAAQLPRIGFGLGYGPISAGVFLDTVTSFGYTTTGAHAMAQCERIDLSLTARAGIEQKFGLLGFGINTEAAGKVELGKSSKKYVFPPTAACPLD
ncbi:MAG: hypothetical protein N2037_06025 [Acidimicrobiales bacterium]|nr:hypothetical protein [Acidimicrobiales bacterium]